MPIHTLSNPRRRASATAAVDDFTRQPDEVMSREVMNYQQWDEIALELQRLERENAELRQKYGGCYNPGRPQVQPFVKGPPDVGGDSSIVQRAGPSPFGAVSCQVAKVDLATTAKSLPYRQTPPIADTDRLVQEMMAKLVETVPVMIAAEVQKVTSPIQAQLARVENMTVSSKVVDPPESTVARTSLPSVEAEKEQTRRRGEMKMGKYDGRSCLETFLLKFEGCAQYNGWGESEKLAHLRNALEGNAQQLLLSCRNELTFGNLLSKLRQRYGSEEQLERFRYELRARKQRQGESLQELANDIERLSALGYPDTPAESRDSLFNLATFLDAISDSELGFEVRKQDPKSLRDALNRAMKIEMWMKSKQEKEQTKPKGVRSVRAEESEEVGDESADKAAGKRPGDRKWETRRDKNYSTPLRNRAGTDESFQVQQLTEQNHLLMEQNQHTRQQCEMLQQQVQQLLSHPLYAGPPTYTTPMPASTATAPPPAPAQRNERSASAREPLRCFNCHEPGHMKINCPLLRERPAASNGARQPRPPEDVARVSAAQADGKTGRRAYLQMKIYGRVQWCLLDTGCELSVLPARVVPRRDLRPTTQRILAANGSEIPVVGTVLATAEIEGNCVSVDGLVSENVFEPMLGIGWLEANAAVWVFKEGVLRMHGKTYPLHSRPKADTWVRRVMVAETTLVPPRTEFNVKAVVMYRDSSDVLSPLATSAPTQWATERCELRPGLYVSGTLIPAESTTAYVRVANVGKGPVQLRKGTVLAALEPVEVLKKDCVSSEAATPEHIAEMLKRVDPSVPETTVDELEKLLNKYPTAFSANELDLGWTDRVVHTIDTGNNPPARQALRKVPIAQREIVDRHIDEQLRQGIIEPTQSSFAANLVIVKKHDGSTRCCCDYRTLNLITKRDAYPLPRIDQCLDALGGNNAFFSTFDLRSSYYQVAVAEEDRHKTAFICHRGMFAFRTMPMGLLNAPATFQRLMDLVMSGLLYETCLVYLDDIVVFSRTLDEHLRRIEVVLQRLVTTGLKLKPSKCKLLQTQVVFLGHVVSGDGIATDPTKTEQVRQWPVPRSVREVRGFLGLCGYYRRFIADYAEIASPLTSLTRKGIKFLWTEDCQYAFDQLKTVLTTPPLLAMPQDDGLFILDTDASDVSIGAVLSQVQDGRERVIAYASRVLSLAQSRYCITRRELLAITVFTRQMRNYLVGRHFLLRTDHSALTWLRKTKEPIGQNARWLEQLEEYDFEVQHRPGTRHGNADALSRLPCQSRVACTACKPTLEDTCNAVRSMVCASTEESAGRLDLCTHDNMVKAQQEDEEVGPVYSALSQSPEQPSCKEVMLWSRASKILWYEWPRLELRDKVLYRRWVDPDGLQTSWQLVVPEQFRRDLFERAHSGMSGGHLGLAKTDGQIQRRMYWPCWRTDTRLWLKRCGPCSRYHRGPPPRQSELNPFPASSPFEVMSMDITGPHRRSKDGNEYILTVMDSFTKFAEAIPIRRHTAQIVARRLVDCVFSRYGVSLRLLSDQGPEFESALMQELCRAYDIEKVRTTSYQPSTNGAIERFHRTLNSMLGKVVSDTQTDWDRHVGPVMAAYRSTVHRSTGYSPNFLVYGRESRAPIDLVLAVGEDEPDGVGRSADEFVDELLQRQRKAHDLARKHLGRAAEWRKKEYDLGVRKQQFSVNQWVWYYYPRRYKGRSPKWTRTYTGPYLVVKVLPPCNYVLQKSAHGKSFVTHANKLKPCLSDTPKSWILDETRQHADPAGLPAPEDSSTGPVLLDTAVEEASSNPPLEEVALREKPPTEGLPLDASPSEMRESSPEHGHVFRARNRLRRPARYDD